ncbi:MAG TPA: sugar transferase [Candidatus Acidoferrales bacterium]|nr:sugar transferase [Candidatus Acidoferrales bacterium]
MSAIKQMDVNAPATAPRVGGVSHFCKRVVDVAGAAILLTFLLPILFVCTILTLLDDGRPVIHRRRVVGLHGTFDAFKLRSMRTDADQFLERDERLRQQFSVNFKLKDDPRVTRVGAMLRRFSLDEIPQLWNVLRGEMSLVGPRMISPAELEKFGDAAWIFTCVKPGLTGYWQVQARTQAGYAERVRMECWYAEHRSLRLDLMILLKTPLRVLRGPRKS